MSSETPVGPTTDALGDVPSSADAAVQMAAATESLRAQLPLIQGEGLPVDPYPA